MPDTAPAADAKLAAETRLPLSRITVLDLTLARAGPTCVRHLADWGANIIRIEPPGEAGEEISGKRDGFDFQNLHRNKKALTLNLKTPEGKAIFMELAKKADVIVENMRAAVKFRLGVDYESVKKVNKRIVYASISGFGQDGPYGLRAGVDQIAQGMGGLMSITGLPGQGPVRVGIPIADLTAGNLLALGTMIALFDREVTGEGRWVTTSLLEAQIFMLDFQASRWLMAGEVAPQAGNDHPTGIPTGVFPTSDGAINIAASSARLWDRFCDTIGKAEWKQKPEWKDQKGRSKDRKAINIAIGEVTKQKPASYWIELLEGAGVPCGPIYSIDQVFADPQVKHLKMARDYHHPKLGKTEVVGSAINLSGVSKEIRTPTPEAGQHNAEILKGLGYTDAQLAELKSKGII
ncbi:MAG: CoA transferase [Alphaproteobacteria bacterium]|nr:CoA transferase [Alphaproteobacteria bacterium]